MNDRRFESSFSAIAGELDTDGYQDEEDSFAVDKSEEKRGKITLDLLPPEYFETSLGRSQFQSVRNFDYFTQTLQDK